MDFAVKNEGSSLMNYWGKIVSTKSYFVQTVSDHQVADTALAGSFRIGWLSCHPDQTKWLFSIQIRGFDLQRQHLCKYDHFLLMMSCPQIQSEEFTNTLKTYFTVFINDQFNI